MFLKRSRSRNSTAGATPLYATINTAWAPKSRFPQPEAVQNQKTPYLVVMEALLKAGALAVRTERGQQIGAEHQEETEQKY